jgi:hypothetical protein
MKCSLQAHFKSNTISNLASDFYNNQLLENFHVNLQYLHVPKKRVGGRKKRCCLIQSAVYYFASVDITLSYRLYPLFFFQDFTIYCISNAFNIFNFIDFIPSNFYLGLSMNKFIINPTSKQASSYIGRHIY